MASVYDRVTCTYHIHTYTTTMTTTTTTTTASTSLPPSPPPPSTKASLTLVNTICYQAGEECAEPAPVPNAYRNVTSCPERSYLTCYKYTCYPGYNMTSGSARRTCQNGALLGNPPVCTRKPLCYSDHLSICSSCLYVLGIRMEMKCDDDDRNIVGE